MGVGGRGDLKGVHRGKKGRRGKGEGGVNHASDNMHYVENYQTLPERTFPPTTARPVWIMGTLRVERV